jgi:hypothetical protein
MKEKKGKKKTTHLSFSLKDIEFDKKGSVVIINKTLANYLKALKREDDPIIEADMYTDAQCLCMCNCA